MLTMFFHSISCSTCSCNARGEGSRLLSHRAALISAYIVSRLEQKMHNCTDAYSWCQMAEGHRLVEMPHLTEHPFRRTMDQYLENWKKKLKMRSKFKNWHWVRDVPRAEAEAFLWPPVQCSGDLLVSHCPLTSHTMHSACLSRARPIVLPVCHTCQLSENHSPALGSFSPHLILTYCYLLLELCSKTDFCASSICPKIWFSCSCRVTIKQGYCCNDSGLRRPPAGTLFPASATL